MTEPAKPPKPVRRGRPKRHTDADLRAQVTAAAMAVFIEKGFAHATTTDIARHAGISKRDMYRVFADKTEIFSETIRARSHLILDLPRPAEETLPPLEALHTIFRLDLTPELANERDAMLNLFARESMAFPELNSLIYDSGIIRSRELLMEWIEVQTDRGALPRCDPAFLAGLMMDVVFGALLPHRRQLAEIDRAAQAKEIIARLSVVLSGLNVG